jgi:hypothetical protein
MGIWSSRVSEKRWHDSWFHWLELSGDKAILFTPHLAYGGVGDVIPPNTIIVFEIELLEAAPQ